MLHEMGHHFKGNGHLTKLGEGVMVPCNPNRLDATLIEKDLKGAYTPNIHCDDMEWG